jgi:peroxiredoxin
MNNSVEKPGPRELADELRQTKENFRTANGDEMADLFNGFVDELTRAGIEESALHINERATDFTLPNAFGTQITLSGKLKNGPVIITWYRGGWCPYCNLALNFLQRHIDEFRALGADLLAITPEKPDESLNTAEKHNLKFEVLTDETNDVAKRYGGVHTLNEKIEGFYLKRGVDKYYQEKGHLPEFPVPATYIVGTDMMVKYAFVESDYRQRAEPSDIVQVLIQLNNK